MYLNITGELLDMPFNLIGQATQNSSTKITDWLPLAVVIIGGILTYYITITSERRKRKFDLKRDIYLEAVEIFSEISLFEKEIEIDLERANPNTAEEFYELDEQYKSRWENWLAHQDIVGKLIRIKYKLNLCETPNEILKNFEKLKDSVSNISNSTEISEMNKLIIESLIPALSKEISRESMWKFWK